MAAVGFCGLKPLLFRRKTCAFEAMKGSNKTKKPSKAQKHASKYQSVECTFVGSDQLILMMEIQRKILSFRDIMDLSPCNNSALLRELVIKTLEDLHRLYPAIVPKGKVSKIKDKPIDKSLAYFCKALKSVGELWIMSNDWMDKPNYRLPSCKDTKSLKQMSEVVLATLECMIKMANDKFDLMDQDEQKKEYSPISSSFGKFVLDSSSYTERNFSCGSSPVTPTSVLPELIKYSARAGDSPRSVCTSPLLWSLRVQAVGKLNPIDVKRLSFHMTPHVEILNSKIREEPNEEEMEVDDKPSSADGKDSSDQDLVFDIDTTDELDIRIGEDKEIAKFQGPSPNPETPPSPPPPQPPPSTAPLSPQERAVLLTNVAAVPPPPVSTPSIVSPPPSTSAAAPPVLMTNVEAPQFPAPAPLPPVLMRNVVAPPPPSPPPSSSSPSTLKLQQNATSPPSPPPPPPPPSSSSPLTPKLQQNVTSRAMPPPPPPPVPQLSGSVSAALAPPPPPPMPLQGGSALAPAPPLPRGNGGGPPPPPPLGAGRSLRPKATTRLKRSTQIGNLYRTLKGKVEGTSLKGKSSGGRKAAAGASASAGGKQGMADALAEMTKRSSYFQQIEEDVQKYSKQITELRPAITNFKTSEMSELIKFHKQVESILENLTDESQVLSRFEGFPTKKLEAIRMAAALHKKLDSILVELQNWKVLPPLGQLFDKVERYFNKVKTEIDALERTKDEEAKKFKSHNIEFDFHILVKIKEAMVDVSSNCMELSLQVRHEIAANNEAGPKGEAKAKECSKLLWTVFQFAFRVYTFAGGHDDRADRLTRELAQEIEKDPHHT